MLFSLRAWARLLPSEQPLLHQSLILCRLAGKDVLVVQAVQRREIELDEFLHETSAKLVRPCSIFFENIGGETAVVQLRQYSGDCQWVFV